MAGRIPARFNVAAMIFFASWINYMLRANMSVNIIAMVPDDSSISSMKSECEALATKNDSLLLSTLLTPRRQIQPNGVTTFNWTVQQQAYVLSGYFWGYAASAFVGGPAAEMWGPRKVVFSTVLFSAILNTITPLVAKWNYMALVMLRMVMGVAGGFMFPSFHALVAHWAPPTEKGKFMTTLLGGSIGIVTTWLISGPLIEYLGWEYAFYVPGLMAIVWCGLWWLLVYDSPVQHPRISAQERQYIIDAIGDKVQHGKGKVVAPLCKILSSFPFLAMVLLHFGNIWGFYFIMTAAPKFVSSALGFNLTSTGTLSSLPYLARMIFSLFFGALGDRIIKNNKMSTTFMRRFFCIFSHIIPGLLLLTLGYVGCAPILSVALITLSMGMNGASLLTSVVNHQDLAPNFAGTLFGIANGFGNISGFISPLVTAHFIKHGNGFAEWRPVFITGASVYIATAVYFMFFGTSETQSWNYVVASVEQEEKEIHGPIQLIKPHRSNSE